MVERVGLLNRRLVLGLIAVAMTVGGILLVTYVSVMAPGIACFVEDEIFCFPSSETVPSPFRPVGIAFTLAGAILLVYALRLDRRD